MKIIILGAGFGGLRLARKLSNRPGIEITLIDRFNYHQFQPLFYQVATAGLDASNISFPIRKIFQHARNVRIRLAEVQRIVPEKKQVETTAGIFRYDALVIAMGADTNFFGNQQIEAHAFPMKSTVEALQLRHRLLHNFEEAIRARDEGHVEDMNKLMNVVVVGGGPTGVELSGAIAEMKRFQLPKDFPELDFSGMTIYLLEGTGRLLGSMSQSSSDDALAYLKRLGVTVKLQTMLKDFDGSKARLQDGSVIDTALVIWAAGIRGNLPQGVEQDVIARGNRIRVNRQCQVSGMEGVYAIGDIAYMEEPAWPNGHPQVAPAAIQQADWLVPIFRQMAKDPDARPAGAFTYRDKGAMATVGRNLAVVDVPKPKWHIRGLFAWLIWMSLHLMLILGVKNRLFIFINWLYNYFTYDQNLRLIFREFDKEK
jgi:NADH dehydrogenase